MRLARIATVGFISVGIAWGCGSDDSGDSGGTTLDGGGGEGAAGGSTSPTGGATSAGASGGTGATGGVGGLGTGGAGAGGAGATGATGGTGATAGAGASGGSGGVTTDGGLVDASAGAGGSTGTGGTVNVPDADVIQCFLNGDSCAGGYECCSKLCDPATDLCIPGQCFADLSNCQTATDCCSLRCENNVCQTNSCIDDNAACTSDTQCCSGTCGGGGTCTPLNLACKTSGNSCTGDAQCCSKYCKDGSCDIAPSWCTQTGDLCSRPEACCSGVCTIANGNSVGICGAPPSGAGCTGKAIEGSVCNGFSDCSTCCSKLCAPHTASGVFVCQPTSGCRTEGGLCRQDTDCCGVAGTDLPGSGNVVCEKEPGVDVGFCKGISCIPQGQVCKYDQSDYVCGSGTSDPNNCCGATGYSGNCAIAPDGVLRCNGLSPCPPDKVEGDQCSFCQLDELGIPRCNTLAACRQPGEFCSNSGDCCGGLPCIPDENGQLRCLTVPDGGLECVGEGGTCTVDPDCCAGFICIKPPGSITGVCGIINPPPPPPPPPPEGGVGTGGAPGTGGSPGTGGTPEPTCSAFGQACNAREDCCNFDIDPDYGCFDGICKLNPN